MHRLRQLLSRLRQDEGMGLIELIASMTILAISIGALMSVYAGTAFSLSRGGRQGSATAIVDRDMEYYRRGEWGNIRLLKGTYPGAGDIYYTQLTGSCSGCPPNSSTTKVDENAAAAPTNDANNTNACNLGISSQNPDTDPTAPLTLCQAVATVVGADGHNYRVYTYVNYAKLAGSTNPDVTTKVVTLIVRQLNTAGTAILDSGTHGILAQVTTVFSNQSYLYS